MTAAKTKRGTDPRTRIRLLSTPDDNGCWNWTATKNSAGYGLMTFERAHGVLAHRVSYQVFEGPIPEGLTVDHLCFNTVCVNPAHLRLLTNLENARNQRKVSSPTCRRGHAWTPENTGPRNKGVRFCRKCSADSLARRKSASS